MTAINYRLLVKSVSSIFIYPGPLIPPIYTIVIMHMYKEKSVWNYIAVISQLLFTLSKEIVIH